MQRAQKFIFGSVAVVAVIGLALYLSQGKTKAPASNLDSNVAPSQQTSVPRGVHRTVAAEQPPPEDNTEGGLLRLTREKVEEYVQRHNRNMASLLAAFHALGDTNYLNEAATNFPNDPRLQWTILARNAFPEDRRKWLDNFKTSSPSNSLANYLSAQDYFKNNQPDAAMKEILEASGKSGFRDYSMDTILDGEDLGRFGGSSAMEAGIAAMAGMAGDLIPELSNLKGVANGIKDAQQQYLKSGDAASAQNLAQVGMNLADRLTTGDAGKLIINQLVGMASQAIVLQGLDQNTSYDFLGGETPAQRLAEIKQQKALIKDLTQNQAAVLGTMSEPEMVSYWERSKMYGELEAMRWLKQQNFAMPNSGN